MNGEDMGEIAERLLLRGRLLSFRRAPIDVMDDESYHYEEDGALLVENGLIKAAGAHSSVKRGISVGTVEIDHRPNLILPGFIDLHTHFPQTRVIAAYAANLLDWLNNNTFPEEGRFADPKHAARVAALFLDELLRVGTTTAAVYCTVHRGSVDALFSEAMKRGMRVIGGKVMMDRNAPPHLLDTPQSAHDDTLALIEKWNGVGRNHVAITPRFAVTSTREQLDVAGSLTHRFPELYVQTHLSESRGEIDAVRALFPDAIDYTDVYARHGLLGRKTLLGHCIHLEKREEDALSEAGSVAVHCPTSNLFLGSGLFPLKRLSRHRASIRVGVASDVGGGTSFSMLRTLGEAYKIQQLLGERLNPLESFYLATRGNAEALSLVDRIGTLNSGSDADIVVLDAKATPAMTARMEAVETLWEELFVLQTLGDDRAVSQTYVGGIGRKRA